MGEIQGGVRSGSVAAWRKDRVRVPESSSAEVSEVGRLSVRQVSKSFEGLLAVDQVNLEVEPGEFLTLLGPSGCGKTTLLRMIAGLEQPSSGKFLLSGMDITALPPERRPLNTVFQRYALFPHLNVLENVAYGLRTKGIRGSEIMERAKSALDVVDMSRFAPRSVRQLSGGQAQRVALARAIVNEPAVLLLDEPLGALDLQLRKRMQIELRAIQSRLGTTFIYVTHDQEEALAMSHRVAVMNHGHVVQVGSPADVYHRPTTGFVADFVGESTSLPCIVTTLEEGGAEVKLDVSGSSAFVSVPDEVELSEGDRASVIVRPETINVTSPDKGRVSGLLEDVIFMGYSHRHLVRLPDEVVIMSDMPEPTSFQHGDKVGMDWAEGSGVLVGNEA